MQPSTDKRPHAHALPVPTFDDDAPFAGGEVAVFPARSGIRVELRFASPYEDVLLVDGERLVAPTNDVELAIAIWIRRRLLALYQAIDVSHGLAGVWAADTFVALDVVDLMTGAFADHSALQKRLAGVDVRVPPFAVLGEVGSPAELASRIRTMYASGTQLEIRHEDSGEVFARRHHRVGR